MGWVVRWGGGAGVEGRGVDGGWRVGWRMGWRDGGGVGGWEDWVGRDGKVVAGVMGIVCACARVCVVGSITPSDLGAHFTV